MQMFEKRQDVNTFEPNHTPCAQVQETSPQMRYSTSSPAFQMPSTTVPSAFVNLPFPSRRPSAYSPSCTSPWTRNRYFPWPCILSSCHWPSYSSVSALLYLPCPWYMFSFQPPSPGGR